MKRYAVVIFYAALLLSCVSSPDSSKVAGTSNETQTVVGEVYYDNGNPVDSAEVILHHKNTSGKIEAIVSKGIFQFDSVDTGGYYLEVNYRDSLGSIQETTVDTADTVKVSCIIELLGSVKGQIDTSLISKTGNTYIYIMEVQQMALVDSLTGAFEAANLPSGNYTLLIVYDTTVIKNVVDTVIVVINSGDTTYTGNNNNSPVVLLVVDTTSGTAPVTVKITFKITDPDGDTVAIHLSYGDGRTDTLSSASGTVSHTYSDSGKFRILLTAADGKGGVGSDSITITVALANPPSSPALVSPQNGAVSQPVSMSFLWNKASGAATYHIQVATDTGFVNLVGEDSTLTDTLKVVSGLSNSATYYWRVRAKNTGGGSPWTSSWGFTTIGLSAWTDRSLKTAGQLRSVVWGNSKFVAVSYSMGDTVLTSSDGITWTGHISTALYNLAVAYGDNQYVAVGSPSNSVGTIQTSPDGVTWTARTSGTSDMICGVAWGDNKFVTVEWWPSTSSDGITWTSQSATSGHLDGVTWGDSQFVAVGRSGIIYTSPNGTTWTSRTAVTSRNLLGVIWGSDKYVAVGDSGTVLSSSDGVTWTVQTSATSNALRSVAYGNSSYIAVGDSGTIVSSSDGITWSGQVSGISNTFSGITYGNSMFVAVGDSGTILTLP
jgi:hypothetical protein